MQHIHHWQAALAQHRGITVTLTQFDGIYDRNSLPQIEGGIGATLKASCAGYEAWLVDLQVKAFEHIHTRPLARLCYYDHSSMTKIFNLKIPDTYNMTNIELEENKNPKR